jgi:hypothetical protein
VVSCIGDLGVEAPKLCIKSNEIARRDILARSWSFVEEDACKEILMSHTQVLEDRRGNPLASRVVKWREG